MTFQWYAANKGDGLAWDVSMPYDSWQKES